MASPAVSGGVGGVGGVSTTPVDARTASAPAARDARHRSSSPSSTNVERIDPFVADDFYPLLSASASILSALRADESSPNADPYRRIAAGSGLASHLYRLDGAGGGVGGAAAGSAAMGEGREAATATAGAGGRRRQSGANAPMGEMQQTAPHPYPPPTPSVRHVRTVPLPDFLAGKLVATKLSLLMGLFPEAGLAWMSSDHRLYLWAYDSSTGDGVGSVSNYCCFTAPRRQCVVSVGLVRPKRGIFKQTVEWCLVVNTPEDAILCAVSREATTSSSEVAPDSFGRDREDRVLRLVPTSFVVPTDSTLILSVCGTEDGRIFLGGNDGRLYEMMYESNVGGANKSTKATDFSDDDFDFDRSIQLHYHPPESIASTILSGTKRALSAAVFGSAPPVAKKARKCRKVSHTAVAPSLVSAVLPGFVLRAASAVLGGDSSRAGPIMSMTMDKERDTLYALTSRGFVHAFDLRPNSTGTSASLGFFEPAVSSCPPRLACTVNCSVSARRYLDTIARGRTYPPSPPSDNSIAFITFPGGAAGAKAGVGGTEGAKAWIKAADAEAQRRQKRRRTGREPRRRADWGTVDGEQGILRPISIHVVPRSVSKSLTLVAITGGGLRYYLSALSSSAINSFHSSGGYPEMLKPERRFTLCHLRAPPPYKVGANGEVAIDSTCESETMGDGITYGGLDGNIAPGLLDYRNVAYVERACHCDDGATLLALDCSSVSEGGIGADGIDAMLALMPDPTARSNWESGVASAGFRDTNTTNLSTSSGGGMSEIISLPMFFRGQSKDGGTSTVLPGGRVWDIAAADFVDSGAVTMEASVTIGSLRYLISRSATPTDAELNVGLVPAYFPPSGRRVTRSHSTTRDTAVRPSLSMVSPSAGILASSLLNPPRGLVSQAFNVMSQVLFKPFLFGPHSLLEAPSDTTMRVGGGGTGHTPTYRISRRVGSSLLGFSSGAVGESASIRKPFRPSVSVARSHGSSTGRKVVRNSHAKSTRLSPWLLSPNVTPLPCWATCHLSAWSSGASEVQGSSTLLALNFGGLHLFEVTSPMDTLASILMKNNASGSRVDRNEDMRSFFEAYGFTEGCAMCLALAVGDVSKHLQKKAVKAALTYANVPVLSANPEAGVGTGLGPANTDFIGIPSGRQGATSSTISLPGYNFLPSNLHDGLLSFLSRLIRPFWYKPAVVVTEGRTIVHHRRYGGGYKSTAPAKVELLLDANTSEEILRPLAAFCKLMRDIFSPVVGSVPGAKDVKRDSMDVDGTGDGAGESRLMTRAIRQQMLASLSAVSMNRSGEVNGRQPTYRELEGTARLLEGRSMHSLYRLASRACQLLMLISLLREAQSMHDLPEVDWGMLHGLTHCQLVTTREGQERIEAVLTNLVCGGLDASLDHNGSGDFDGPSETAQSDRLSLLLSRSCYLYYSAGSRLTYLGFRTARSALLDPFGSPRRMELSNRAARYFLRAAAHWYNPGLVTGKVLHMGPVRQRSSRDNESSRESGRQYGEPSWYNDAAVRALEHGSPLARAAQILMDLGDVAGTVNVCLRCAANFGGEVVSNKEELGGTGDEETSEGMLPWERGLYHRPRPASAEYGEAVGTPSFEIPRTPSSRSIVSVVSGMNVTSTDALMTCHAIIFHHLSYLLSVASQYPEAANLADRMVAVCSSSSDPDFLCVFYEHLLGSDHADVLLRIDSVVLEVWLRDEKRDANLLWKYYVLHGRDALAAETIRRKGCAKDISLSIKERIECLTKAVNSFSAAAERKSVVDPDVAPIFATSRRTSAMGIIQSSQRIPSREELVRAATQVREQLDVALLQRRILDAAGSARNFSLDEAKLSALSNSLLSATDLYNDYAAPLGLYDICLIMLCTCRNNDATTITTLWKSILSEELLPCRTRDRDAASFVTEMARGSMVEEECTILEDRESGDSSLPLFEDGDWIPRLKERVTSLGIELYGKGADYTFPLELLVECLEGLRRCHESCTSRTSYHSDDQPMPWPLEIFFDIGVRFPSLLEAYDSVLFFPGGHGMVSHSEGSRDRLRHLASIAEVLKLWTTMSFSRAKQALNSRVRDGEADGISSAGDPDDAFLQLSQAVSSGGLLVRLDTYKSSLETALGGNSDELYRVHSMFQDVEDSIRRNM